MHTQTRRQNVEIHFRHPSLMQRVHQQSVHHRPQTGHRLQALGFKIAQPDGDVRAEAETKGGHPGMVNPGNIRQMLQHILVQHAGILGQLAF